MTRFGKVLLWALGGGAMYWVMANSGLSETAKLAIWIVIIVLWLNYETGTAKDRMDELQWRIDDLERDLRDRNYIE
jgi:hypothetical protein